jgi:hypothetical protein
MTQKKFRKLYKNREWKLLFDEQVRITAKTLYISIEQAEKRYSALLISGLVDTGSPDDPIKKEQIDRFLMNEIK